MLSLFIVCIKLYKSKDLIHLETSLSENSAFSDSFCVFQSLFIIGGIETKYLLFEGRLIV